ENYSPPQVTRVLDRTGEVEIAMFKRENRVVVPLSEIPELLVKAFLAIEDDRFYEHFGVDFKAIARSTLTNIRRAKLVQGASTIELQLPRNIHVTSRERTLRRKLRDVVLALQIEKRYSKDQILEFYLNQVLLGSGAYGVKAAAKTYFDKDDLRELTVAESAMLAGLARAPSLDSPLRSPDRALRRCNLVLNRMYETGVIDQEAYEKALREPPQVHPPKVEYNRFPYFIECMKSWLAQEPDFDYDSLRSRGYIIRSTLDTSMTAICQEELCAGLREAEVKWQERKIIRLSEEGNAADLPQSGQVRLAEIRAVTSDSMTVRLGGCTATIKLPKRLPYYQPSKILVRGNLIDVRVTTVNRAAATFEGEMFDRGPVQGAVVVLDARTGEVLALTGGYDFWDSASNGQWNRAVQAERQSGSCFKPFVYALALEAGLTPATVFNDRPVKFGNSYSPQNYERQFFGPTPLVVALQHSRNVVTVLLYEQLINRFGARTARDRLLAFDVGAGPPWRIPTHDLSVSLGSAAITPLSMAAAYIPFLNQGVALKPTCVQEVTDSDGSLKKFRPAEKVVLSESTAQRVIYMLRSAVLYGTGAPITRYFEDVRQRERDRAIPEMAGKTGTTDDCTDAWFTGFTPELIVAVYVGFDSPRTLGPQMTGSYVAAPIWCRIVDRILKTRKTWVASFDLPEDIKSTGSAVGGGQPVAQEPVPGGAPRDLPVAVPPATSITEW
ncbi:transglycosylase domain-containing protein, partial [Candidatus Sumerlaeota bacterium]|nr:transglycosylase domain-containing protein [Candidatus Sumerlaeota bacterium]